MDGILPPRCQHCTAPVSPNRWAPFCAGAVQRRCVLAISISISAVGARPVGCWSARARASRSFGPSSSEGMPPSDAASGGPWSACSSRFPTVPSPWSHCRCIGSGSGLAGTTRPKLLPGRSRKTDQGHVCGRYCGALGRRRRRLAGGRQRVRAIHATLSPSRPATRRADVHLAWCWLTTSLPPGRRCVLRCVVCAPPERAGCGPVLLLLRREGARWQPDDAPSTLLLA